MMTRTVVLAFAVSAAAIPDAQTPRFSSGVEMVRVDVLATEKGRPIAGLRAADFEVRDNGVPQQLDLVSFERLQLNVVLVLDLSSSVKGDRLDDLRKAGRTLLGRLKPEDNAALLGFNHAVVQGSGLTKERARLLQMLGAAQPAGDTALIDATYTGMIVGESQPGRALVMVFSDGLDVSSWLPASRVLDVARRSDAVVYGISMKGTRPAFLEEMTNLTGGRLLDVESRNLSGTFVEVMNEFRERYLLSYAPRGVEPGGWHTLDVRVKGRKATIKARPGYLSDRRPDGS